MKKSQLLLAAGFFTMSLAIVSCGGGSNTDAETPTVDSTLLERAVVVNLDSSTVAWKGEMLGVYAHEGIVKLSEAAVSVKGDSTGVFSVTSGSFVVDMNTITPTDANYNAEEDKTPEMLVGHLRSADFFSVDSIGTASFVINSVTGNTAAGKLNVRGVEGDETVTDIVVTVANGVTTVTGKLVFDRTKYGVIWTSTAKEMVLSNDIEINVNLIGQ
jgi:polyisoprenoid-binding protein YceI